MTQSSQNDTLLAFLLSLAVGIVASNVVIPLAIAQPEVPMKLQHAEGTYTLTVPNSNTTKSANGSRLRLYDAHIAKMFEVTRADCQELLDAGSRSWFYFAENGKIDMGEFNITCKLANQIATAYGLGKPKPTIIEYLREEAGSPIAKTRLIPVLNITGNKAQRWMNFTRQFKPIARAGNTTAPKASFFASVLPQVKRRTSIPVLLPDRLLPTIEQRTYFDIQATRDSYNVSIYFTPDCGGATACYIGAVEAQRGGKLTSPEDLAGSTYKNIRLANSVKGIFWNTCGAYCTAAVEWQTQEILYRVTAKNGEEQPLVQMANSAIATGVR